MRIKIQRSFCRLSDGRVAAPGDEVDLPDDEGRVHCEAGLAVPVDSRGVDVETATPAKGEQRTASRRRKAAGS